ncbi:zwei Ig domain protein zig-8-like [Battus philenor]|uniref:zwei Ig domain protein zig-8-like n=1 Tax=Battus philenor TaxID=42288 RepID=UPI0035CED52B
MPRLLESKITNYLETLEDLEDGSDGDDSENVQPDEVDADPLLVIDNDENMPDPPILEAEEAAPQNPTTTEDNTVTSFYALSTGVVPAPVMLRLGNSTIDSTKSFKVPQPSSDSVTEPDRTLTVQPRVVLEMVPHVVSAKNTYFDHDRKYGPTFEDIPKGNATKITVQLGEDAYLNCRISLLQDKTVSWVRRRGKEELPELLTVGAVTYAADNRVTVAKRYPGNWRLLIKEVKPDDEGFYECQISTHPPRVSRIYLHVNTPQVWVVDEAGAPLLEKYYEAESTLALVCRARHVDTPAVLTWIHEGRALNADTTRGGISVKTEQVPGGADSLLRLARVNGSDAGNYTCAVRGARPHTVAVHVLNEESLAELHAGSSPFKPSLESVVSLATFIILLNKSMLNKAVILPMIALHMCKLNTLISVIVRIVLLLPT